MSYLNKKLGMLWNSKLVRVSFFSAITFLALNLWLFNKFDVLSWLLYLAIGVFVADIFNNTFRRITMTHVIALGMILSISFDLFGVFMGAFTVPFPALVIKAIEQGVIAWVFGNLIGVSE